MFNASINKYVGYCVSNNDNILDIFNDALNTFYLRLIGVGNIVKVNSESEKEETPLATWATLSD